MMTQFSKTAFVTCCIFVFLTGFFYYPKWKQQATEATISWDVSGYYMYLPAIFIYHDLKKCRFVDNILTKYHPTPDFQQAFRHSSGNYVMKYTMGQAYMFAPFFFIAHIYTSFTKIPADGFSFPYQFCIGIGMILYSFIGLWYLRKVLLKYFHDKTVAITLLIVVFATNYLDYAAIDGAMTHNTLFMLYSLYLYFIIKFYENPRFRWSLSIGLIAGLLTLVRPTEIICLLIPLFWNVSSLEELTTKIHHITHNVRCWVAGVICFGLIVLCQGLYWKWSSGNWIVDGYQNEGFTWLHPHIGKGLFSYKGGWFTYTPIMMLVIPGFICLYSHSRKLFLTSLIFCSFFLYICFSWRDWWYGVSLGQRAIIQAYPIFCFPIAAVIERISYKKVFSALIAVLIAICTYYNLWLTHQAHRGGLFQGGAMTSAYFWNVIGRFDVPKHTQILLDNEEQVPGFLLNKPITINYTPNSTVETLNKDHQYSNTYTLEVPRQILWVRANVSINTPVKEWDIWRMPQVIITFYLNGKAVKTNYVRISRILSDGETSNINVDAKLPSQFNKVTLLFWNAVSEKSLNICEVKVFGFK